jgi:hypothetical protein
MGSFNEEYQKLRKKRLNEKNGGVERSSVPYQRFAQPTAEVKISETPDTTRKVSRGVANRVESESSYQKLNGVRSIGNTTRFQASKNEEEEEKGYTREENIAYLSNVLGGGSDLSKDLQYATDEVLAAMREEYERREELAPTFTAGLKLSEADKVIGGNNLATAAATRQASIDFLKSKGYKFNFDELSNEQIAEAVKAAGGMKIADTTKPIQEDRTWFQASALWEDGYQPWDVSKTILGTATDVAEHVGAGLIGMGEMALDAMATIGPYLAQGYYYSNGGGFNLSADMAFNQAIATSKSESAKFVEEDLYNEEEVAKTIITNPVKDVTGVDAETDSVLGEKSDALAQSGGQLLGTAALQAVGVPWYLTTGLTAMGSESENALKQGATLEEAALSGMVTAGAEILTEKISGGISFGAGTLDDVVTK